MRRWEELEVAIDMIESIVRSAEEKGLGGLSYDNLYLGIRDFQVRMLFSQESEIHLSHLEENTFGKAVLNRWYSNRWLLIEESSRKCNLKTKPPAAVSLCR